MARLTVLQLAATAAAAAAVYPDKLRLGTDYYPEAWDSAMWEADAQAMAAAGISVVRVGEFAWHSFQPNASSPFLFDWLDSALTVLAKYNVSAIVGTPTASPPAWLITGAPRQDLQIVDTTGYTYRYGSRQNVNHLHPDFITATQAIVTAIGTHYANDPRVVAFQLDNEIAGQSDFSPITQGAWASWLEQQYGTVDALNSAWGTVFWSHTYNTWGEVPLPWDTLGTAHNPGLALDYRRFLSSVGVGYMSMQADILRAVAPSKPITSNMMGLYAGVDYSSLATIVDFVAFDNYPATTWNPGQPYVPASANGGASLYWPNVSNTLLYAPALAGAVMRGAKAQQPFYIMEQQAGNAGQAQYYGAAYPELARLFAWQMVANGADGVQFFRWRTTRVGYEQHWEGIQDWDASTDNDKYVMVSQMGKEFALASTAVLGKRVRARVALLLSPDSRWALEEQPLSSDKAMDVQPQLLLLLTAFRANRVGVDVVFVPAETSGAQDGRPTAPSTWQGLAGYDIVLAPTLWVVPQWLAAELDSFVQGGGQLLLTMRSGSKTSTNQYTNLTLPGLVSTMSGVKVKAWDPNCSFGETAIHITALNRSYAVDNQQGRMCEALTPTTATVLATYGSGYYTGRPVVTANAYGSKGGSVFYSGTVSGDVYFYEWLGSTMAQAVPGTGGLPFGPRLPEGVEVSIRDTPAPAMAATSTPATAGTASASTGSGASATTVFVLNFNGVPVTVTVPEAAGGTNVLTGRSIDGSGSVTLQPHDIAVIAV